MEKKTEDKLKVHLKEQILFLLLSCKNYDEGHFSEAIRISTTLRTLLHDTSKSKSLLNLLGKKKIKFLNSSVGYFPENIFFTTALCGFDTIKNFYIPFYDKCELKYSNFNDWWEEIIISSPKQKEKFTRKDIVLFLSNKEGGAHVDPNLKNSHFKLKEGEFLGWEQSHLSEFEKILGSERASVRQIAHEIIVTIKNFFEEFEFDYNFSTHLQDEKRFVVLKTENNLRKTEAKIRFQQACHFRDRGDFKEAITCFERAIKIDGTNRMYFTAYSYFYYLEEKFDDALKVLKRYKNQKDYYILNNKGLIYLEQEDFISAKKYFIESLKIKSDYRTLNNLALTYFSLKDIENTFKYTISSLKEKYSPESYNRLIVILNNNSNLSDKKLLDFYLEIYNEKILKDDHLESFYTKVICLSFKLGNNLSEMKDAIDFSNLLIKRKVNKIHGYLYLGQIYTKLHNLKTAEKNLKFAENIDSENELVYNSFGNLYFDFNKNDLAEKNYKKAIDLNKHYSDPINGLANCYLKQKKYNLAENLYEEAITLDSSSFEYFNGRGLSKMLQNKYKKAIKDFDKAISLNVNYLSALNNRAWSNLYLEKFENVFEDLVKILNIDFSYKYKITITEKKLKKFEEYLQVRTRNDVHKEVLNRIRQYLYSPN